MPLTRKALRKRIELTEDVRELMRQRDAGGGTAALAACARVTPEGKAERQAQIWGMVGEDGQTEADRKALVDKADLVTLIEPAEVAAAKAKYSVEESGGSGRTLVSKPAPETEEEEAAVESSLPLSIANIPAPKTNWNPLKSPASRHCTAREAMRLIGAHWTDGRIGAENPDLNGDGVNVIIVDVGVTRRYLKEILPDVRFRGGFRDRDLTRPQPGKYVDVYGKPGDWHGNMIARNILRLAPKVRIYDAPLLPGRVVTPNSFTEDAEALFEGIEDAVLNSPHKDEPWIIVNAWAVADTIQEFDLGLPANRRYADGRDHPFNRLVARMSGKFDMVFAAGNFGAYAPDPSAGIYDRGNDRSIKGTNALPEVLTVGAVTATGEWIGAASHGYGPKSLTGNGALNEKPDIAAPSWFCEPDDPALVSTGTSAACGVAAGMLAALRTQHSTETPAQMFQRIRDMSTNRCEAGWNGRTGHGIPSFDMNPPPQSLQLVS